MVEKDGFWEAVPISRRPVPRKLYHYTDIGGLTGILGSGKFWATDMDYLNDTSEFDFGSQAVQVAFNRLANLRSKEFLQKKRRALYGHYSLEQILEATPESLPTIRSRFVYGVACFCSDGDLLGQWQRYGGAGGFAIGFDGRLLKSTLLQEAVRLCEVVYKRDKYRPKIEQEINSWLNQLGKLEQRPDLDTDEAMLKFGIVTLGLAAQIKHHGFKDELEWRIADLEPTTSEDVKHRDTVLGRTPYVEIDICRTQPLMPIVEIVIGPGDDQSGRTELAKDLLSTKGYDVTTVNIWQSELPLRL